MQAHGILHTQLCIVAGKDVHPSYDEISIVAGGGVKAVVADLPLDDAEAAVPGLDECP